MLIVSEFLVELDATIVNVALPDMGRDLDAGTDALQWIVDSYMLVFGGFVLVAGMLGDQRGRRQILFAGLLLFGATSIVAALAPTAEWLIGARGMMGLGAALILPTTLVILTEVFEGAERVRAFSLWSGTAGLSFAIGPTAGGALVEAFGWPSIFLVNIPIVAAATVACLLLVPRRASATTASPDWVGAILSVLGLGLLLYTIIEAPTRGWSDVATVAGLALAVAVGAGLLAWERVARRPMLDVRLLRSRVFSASGVAIGLQFFATAGALFVLTQYLQGVLGYSPFGAGIRLAPVALCLLITAPTSIAVQAKLGTKVTVSLGLAVTSSSLLLMTGMSDDTGYGLVAIGLVLAGVGGGLSITPAVTAMLSELPGPQRGSSAALNNTAVIVGSALGVAVLGSLLSTRYGISLADALPTLPTEVVDGLSSGVATAAQTTQGGQLDAATLAATKSAFTEASAQTFMIAGFFAAGAVVIAAIFLPHRIETPDFAAESLPVPADGDEPAGEPPVTSTTSAQPAPDPPLRRE